MKESISVTIDGNTYTATLITEGKKQILVFKGQCRVDEFGKTDTPAMMKSIAEQELRSYIQRIQAGQPTMQWKPCPDRYAE